LIRKYGSGLIKKKDSQRVNRAIRAPRVRVIDADGSQVGIISNKEALDLAQERGLDLVEVAPNSDPPVCRIMNYGKFKFQQSKKSQDARKKQKTIQVKEIKFRPRIDQHDFDFKFKHIRKFLGQGNKVKAFVHFRGREMAHKDQGKKILDRIVADLGETAVVEKAPHMEGNRMFLILAPAPTAPKGKSS
jgi:translation initiation factor IF-3